MSLPAAARAILRGDGQAGQAASSGRPVLSRRRLLLQVAVGLLVGGVLVFLGLRQVSAGDLERALGHAHSWYLVAAVAGAAGFILARTWRYQVLLFPRGSASAPRRPPALGMLTVTLASWGPGLVLPTPTSDATFIWLGRTRLGVPVHRCATAVVIARMLDFGSLLVVGLLAAPLAGVRLPLLGKLSVVAGIAVILAGLAALLWGPARRRLGGLARRLPYLGSYAARLEAGLEELARTRSLVQLILSTAAARLFTALQYMSLFAAVGLTLGFWQAWFALSVRTLLLAIPIQGPAGLGTTQLWWVTALLILGIPRHAAILGGLSVHVLDLVISLSLAALGWALLLLPASLRRGRRRSTGSVARQRQPWVNRWWALPGLIVFAVARIPSFAVPHWYADEAGYATVARELLRGKTLYLDAWNNKPPLQLWTVAAPVGLFGPSEAGLHALTFISGLLTLGAVAYAARRLLSPWRSCFAVLAAALLLGMPVLDAELIVPESLMIAPAAWAGVLLITRLSRPQGNAGRAELWPLGVGALTAMAIGYQQTAVADAAAFGLILAVAGRSWRQLALYSGAVVALTGAWLGVMAAAAGPHRVAFALAGFYVEYTRSVLPQTVGGGLRHWGLVLLIVAVICAGALLHRGNRDLTWGFWVWAGAVLSVSAAAQQAYAHFLTPAVAPTVLALAAVPSPHGIPALSRRIQAAGLLLAGGVLVFGVMARTAGLDWIPSLAGPGMNSYRNLQTYYGGLAWAAVDRSRLSSWRAAFDERVDGDAAAAAWVRRHGLSGHPAVVWSNDPWPYLLADLPLLLPTPPIYNDMTLLGTDGQVSARVQELDPDLIVTAEDADVQYPEVNSVLDEGYRPVDTEGTVTVWLRRDLEVPPAISP